MHPDEVKTDVALVRRVLAVQFPAWADLPIEPVPSRGTDNALYRLGEHMVVRLPRIHWAAGPENFHRGVPLAVRDTTTRAAIASLPGEFHPGAVTAAWKAALQVPD